MTPESANGGAIKGLIINACYPRSGHRFLREILAGYFGARMVFYEPYADRVVGPPADSADLEAVNYVKTHDFDLQGPAVMRDRFPGPRRFLVQVRHPLESIASYWEFSLRHGLLPSSGRLAWNVFLLRQLSYWKRFCDTWLRPAPDGSLVVSYDQLCGDCQETAARAIAFLAAGAAVDRERLAEVIGQQDFLQYVGDAGSQRSQRRQLPSFEFFDAERFRQIESELLDAYLRPLAISPLLR